MDRTELEAALRYALDEHREMLLKRLGELASEFIRHGSHASSMHAHHIAERVVEAAKELASAEAETIALACGSDAREYIDIYDRVRALATRQFHEIHVERVTKLGSAFASFAQGDWAVESRIAKAFEHHRRELRLGIARGRALMAIGDTINITGSQGVAVKSDGAVVKASRDHVNVAPGWSPADFLEMVRQFREAVSAADQLSADAKDGLDDAAYAIERAAQDDSPDPSRLKRFAKGLTDRLDVLAIGKAGSPLAPQIERLLAKLPGG